MGFQKCDLGGGGHIFIEVDIYIGRLTMPMGSGDQGDRVLGAIFLFGHISHGCDISGPKVGRCPFLPTFAPWGL